MTASAPGEGLSVSTPPGGKATFRSVFAVREFRTLFGTILLSLAGDELARVALAVLVYQRTSSPLLSAVTFAISYLPWLVGGPLLATLADRFPRHRVLIATDAARAVVVAGMAIPGMPLPALLALMFVLSCGSPPFESARSALFADILDGDRYAVANSLTNVGGSLAQVGGVLVAGGLSAALNPSAALLIDAASFAVSAVWLSTGLRRRPAPIDDDGGRPWSIWADVSEGLRFIGRSSRLRAIIGITWLGSLFLAAFDGVVVPLVGSLGGGPTAVGVLLAANPCGLMVGGLVLARFVPQDLREKWVPQLMLLSLLPLLLAGLVTAYAPPGRTTFAVVVGLMFVSGLGSAWSIALNIAFVQEVPTRYRGRAYGVAVTGLNGVQGLGILVAGFLAEWLSPSAVVALLGSVGVAVVTLPLLVYWRTRPSVASGAAAAGPSVS